MLEDLLRMRVMSKRPISNHRNEDVEITPEFRVAVQGTTEDGVHIIIHANGHNSDTLDYVVKGDKLTKI